MFPTASSDHIIKCLKQANGHMNTAVELLLMDCQSSPVTTQVVVGAYVHRFHLHITCRIKENVMIKT